MVMVHHFTTTLICDGYKVVAMRRGANEDTVCPVPSGPSVLQRVPRWEKRPLGLRDTQGDALSPADLLYFRGYLHGRKDLCDYGTHKGNGSSAKKKYTFWQ